jgi:GNAT superfamily N-acetyltransferase
MQIKTIHWQETLPIRHQVLWRSKPVEFCKVEGDEVASHYGAYIGETLACVASIYIDGSTARLRKFATLEHFQGKGIGSKIFLHILRELAESGINYFWCDARKSALSFYQKFGLEKQDGEFEKSGVLYCKMALVINHQ